MFIGSGAGSVRAWRWDGTESKELCAFHAFADGSWVVLTPEGHYGEGSVPYLRGVEGETFIPLSRLKRDCYEPGLMSRVLGSEQAGVAPR